MIRRGATLSIESLLAPPHQHSLQRELGVIYSGIMSDLFWISGGWAQLKRDGRKWPPNGKGNSKPKA